MPTLRANEGSSGAGFSLWGFSPSKYETPQAEACTTGTKTGDHSEVNIFDREQAKLCAQGCAELLFERGENPRRKIR
jgi:hypothetical protein